MIFMRFRLSTTFYPLWCAYSPTWIPLTDYLQPELFRFTEGMSYGGITAQTLNYFAVNDNKNLAARASSLLVRMCGVTPPVALINPILDAIFEAIQNSPVRTFNKLPDTINGI